MDFTPTQRRAIDERGCSLLISAGAGSGKTAVLTERIVNRLCDESDECNITDFLIVTFTNAAASELSDRIRRNLTQRAEVDVNNNKILHNIALLPLAKISTINSFCYELVRENFQTLGLSAGVRIADDAEIDVIKEKLMNEVLDDFFENGGDDGAFIAAYEIFSSAKSDAGFVETLLSLDKKTRSLSDPEGFFKHQLDMLEEGVTKEEFFDTEIGKRFKNNTIVICQRTDETLLRLIGMAAQYEDLKKNYLPALDAERDYVKQVLAMLQNGSYDEVKAIVDSAQKHPLKSVRNAQDPAVKDFIKDCKNNVCDGFYKHITSIYSCNSALLRASLADSGVIFGVLWDILRKFDEKLTERKKELSIMEFADAERFTAKLLVKSSKPFEVTPLAETLRARFAEIYIDEYQDVNPLQDMIFKSICRHEGDRECARFMVGDIKQSIYRFRGASSEIFMNYRREFDDAKTKSLTKKLFMSNNFRSSESVIGLSNLIFKRLMDGYFQEGDALEFSRIEEHKVEKKARLLAFNYDKNISENVSAPELEASLVAKMIKERVGNEDHKGPDGKTYKYSDIGLLSRSKSTLKIFEKELIRHGIPVACDVGESFYGKGEVVLCIDILSAIDNPERDIYLAGFMRSFAGGFSDDELVCIKNKNKKMSLYNACISYCSEDVGTDGLLGEKCKDFINKLRELRAYSRGKSADKLLWKLFCDYDMLSVLTAGAGGDEVRRNLLKLYEISRDFGATSFRGVGAFIDYIRSAAEKSDVKAEREVGADCVKLMTIHGSKGLEFPVCFVVNLAKKFSKADETSRLVFSERAGLATVLCDAEVFKSSSSDTKLVSVDTPLRRFAAGQIEKESVEEEMRILYVALTRARDELIMCSSIPKKLDGFLKDAVNASFCGDMPTNHMSAVMMALAYDGVLEPFFEAAGIRQNVTARDAERYLECEYISPEKMMEIYESQKTYSANSIEVDEKERRIDRDILEWLSDYNTMEDALEKEAGVLAKVTVSDLKKGLLDEEVATKKDSDILTDNDENGENTCVFDEDKEKAVPKFMLGEAKPTGAEKGTAMHLFMQFASYERCEKEGCEAEARRLANMGFIEEERLELLDFPRLDVFFKSEFYKKIADAEEIFREKRFNLEADAFDANLPGEVLVQGVIDLFYRTKDGKYVVVDFKTDRVFGENAESILRERHADQLIYYRRAVEEMVGKSVDMVYIYSFSLMKEIEI